MTNHASHSIISTLSCSHETEDEIKNSLNIKFGYNIC